MFRKVMKTVTYMLSLPKSLIFNLRAFPLATAVRMPVFLHYRTRVLAVRRNAVRFQCPVRTGLVRLGFGGTETVEARRRNILSVGKGVLQVDGEVRLGEGFVLKNEGQMHLGANFSANRNCKIVCAEEIEFGKDCLLGWDVVVRDVDGHRIIENGVVKPDKKAIRIGSHCWICSETHILKGAEIGNDNVVAYQSLLNKKLTENNALIAGKPGKVIRTDVNWEE